ncbi:MAG: PAS domain-containing protein [Bacillota bacterium]|nr:PAS domain-containing protein [Bacillota bacterium]
MHKSLEPYLKLLEFWSMTVDKNTELVLHDMSGKKPSIVFIHNRHVSGRDIDAPLSAFAQQMLGDKSDTLIRPNYATIAADGRTLRTCSYFIRDDDNTLLGMICVNADISAYAEMAERMRELAALDAPPAAGAGEDSSVFLTSAAAVIQNNIREILTSMDAKVPLNRLTAQEKQQLIAKLHQNGVFNLKGSVARVAEAMGVSEPTIYRYLPK